jgi:hypothetical protein
LTKATKITIAPHEHVAIAYTLTPEFWASCLSLPLAATHRKPLQSTDPTKA